MVLTWEAGGESGPNSALTLLGNPGQVTYPLRTK